MMKERRPGLLVVALAIVTGGCATTGQNGAPLQILVPVFYATDRDVNDNADADNFYGDGRAEVTAGLATVALSTRKQGKAWFADWTRWQPRIDGIRNRNELIAVEPMSAGDFESQLLSRAANTGDRSVLVYIHGYSRRFDEAATNAAIVAFEMNLQSVPMMYSWPADGSIFDYRDDVESVDWATEHLREFLQRLAAQDGVETVHILAHSLGNRGFLNALADIDSSNTEAWRFGEIVLMAPDVDVQRFQNEYLPVLRRIESRVTLYASETDFPLRTSRRINNGDRLGDAKAGILIAKPIETVVVSDVVNVFNGHVPHLHIAEVQDDLHFLINERKSADERPTLTPATTDQGRYWRVLEADARRESIAAY